MKIEIDNLTESELAELNRRIVERRRTLQQIRTQTAMMELPLGSRVSFETDGGWLIIGVVTKHNRKTVTVITEDGEVWRVSPSLLTRLGDPVNTRKGKGLRILNK